MAIMEVVIKNNWTYLTGIHTIPHIIQNSLQYLWIDPETNARIFKSLLVPEEMKFPSGVWPRVKKRLIAAHHEFVERDESDYPILDNPIPTAIHLRDYQEGAKKAYIEAQNEHGIRYRGTLAIATGGGKCITPDSMIFTARGMEYIGDYDHGKPDTFEPCEIQIINEDRIFERTKRFYNDGKHLTVKITTEHGFVLEGSETQKIRCILPNGDKDWVDLQDITMEHHALIQKAQNCFGKESFTPYYAKFKSEFPESEYKSEVTEEMAEAFGEQDYLKHDLSELLFYFTGVASNSLTDKTVSMSISKADDGLIGFRLPQFPKFFRYAKKELVRAYIKGLFHPKMTEAGEPYAYWHRGQKRFLKELQIVLLNFGIVSKRNDEAVEITGPALALFEKIIVNGEEIPEMYKKGQNNFIDRIAKLEVNFEGTEIVDFEIPGTHSFFANGFIAHNTVMAAEVISKVNSPTVYFVHTKDLLYQTVREMRKFFGNNMVGSIGAGEDCIYDEHGKVYQIIIVMIQTISYHGKKENFDLRPEYKTILKAAKLLIIDEAHHSAADTWFWVSMECEAPFRLGLTATPWRVDGRDLLLEGSTGPVVYEIDAATLIAKGWLSKPTIKLYPVLVQMDDRFKSTHIEISKELYQELTGEEPMKADMTNDGLVMYEDEGNNWHRRFKVGVIFNHHRNSLIIAAARSALSQGQTVLIIVQQKIHGIILQNFLDMLVGANAEQDHPERPWFINSDTDNDVRDMALNRVRTGKLRCLIGTSLYDEGIDLPSINLVIMAAGGKSETKSVQRLGRSLRLGTHCQYLEADKKCSLLSTNEKAVYCIELQYDVSKYDAEAAKVNAVEEIDEYLGNIQHISATHKEVWGTRKVEDANAKEILRMYNTCFSDGLLTGKVGIPQIDEKATEIKNLYYEVQDALEDNNIGPSALVLKGTPTFENGEVVLKPITPEMLEKHKIDTENAHKLFKLCAEVLGIESTVSIKCEYKQTKKEVTFIDFIDVCDTTLYKHSWQRLEIYNEKKHDPQEGDIEEFKDFPVVQQTQNMLLDYEQMMRTYGQFLISDKDDDVPEESNGLFD